MSGRKRHAATGPGNIPAFAATLRRAIWPLLVFGATIELATIVLLDPLLVLLLERIMALGEDRFVGNIALVSFLLSPRGVIAVITAAAGLVLVNALALGGISLILWSARQRIPIHQLAIWRALLRRLPALMALGTYAVAAMLVLALPVIATAYGARHLFLSGGDFYFYISTWPGEFVAAVAVVGLVALLAGIAGLWLVLRTGLALPICLLRQASAGQALRVAMQVSRGRKPALMLRLLATGAGLAVLWVLGLAALSGLLDWLFARPVPEAMLYWVGLGFAVVAALVFSVLTAISRAALVLVLLADRAADDALPLRADRDALRPGRGFLRLATALLLAAALPAVAAWETALAGEWPPAIRPIAITAHRAGSAHAPENTLAALRKAIAAGADYVEIDVQETEDGHVVLLHDTDLRRVAGLARPIWDMRLADLQQLDAGSWFSPEFHGERIPTLRDFALAARGKVRLNVELKENGHSKDLAARVVAVLRQTGVADQAAISSLDMRLLRQVRRIAPKIRLGLILATGIGDLHSIDVDFLALSSRLATQAVIRRAHANGREVHVWTLDDEGSIVRALLAGADNIITSDPRLGVQVRSWFEALSGPERLALRIGGSLETGWLNATGRTERMRASAGADQPAADEP